MVGFAHIGMNNVVQKDRVVTIIPPKTKTANRILEVAKGKGMFIDASRGRSHRSILIMDEGTVIASCISTMTLLKRFNMLPEQIVEDGSDEEDQFLLEENEDIEEGEEE